MINKNYREDIDGLRAIAVMSVILFHFGCLPNGYLGVDIFLVISGYLITKIIHKEVLKSEFSLVQFYLRRTRRIIPLVLFVNVVAILLGFVLMLPDDFENLCESVVATNAFSNNILQFLTTANYWDVVNEFKPLMHTWSLGIEEQFYIIYPLIFLACGSKRIKWFLPILLFLTLVSLLMFFFSNSEPSTFYLIPYRFFELAVGGIGAFLLKDRMIQHKFKWILVVLLLLIMLFNLHLPDSIKLCFSIVLSIGILISENDKFGISSILLENKLSIGLGKISFSLYMWHQLVLAYSRYAFLGKIHFFEGFGLMILIILLSVLSYYFIEQPFRNKKRVSTPKLLWITGIVFVATTASSLYIYLHSGVVKNFPELNINKSNVQKNMHSKYNDRIYKLDLDFKSNNKIKVLVVGNSFARDWANILLESTYKDSIELCYIYDIYKSENTNERLQKADYIFFSEINKNDLKSVQAKFIVDTTKIWVVGTKNFGFNNGIFYNHSKNAAYYLQRTPLEDGFLENNNQSKREWGSKYVDMIGININEKNTVPVFTPDFKFISQDCRHLTNSGAMYFSEILKERINLIFKKK